MWKIWMTQLTNCYSVIIHPPHTKFDGDIQDRVLTVPLPLCTDTSSFGVIMPRPAVINPMFYQPQHEPVLHINTHSKKT